MNNNDKLSLDSTITIEGKYHGKKVQEIVNKYKGKGILWLIKKGLMFDDDVLSAANITTQRKNYQCYNEVVEHEKELKKYKKETANINEISKSIETLRNYDEISDETNSSPIEEINNSNGEESQRINMDIAKNDDILDDSIE